MLCWSHLKPSSSLRLRRSLSINYLVKGLIPNEGTVLYVTIKGRTSSKTALPLFCKYIIKEIMIQST